MLLMLSTTVIKTTSIQSKQGDPRTVSAPECTYYLYFDGFEARRQHARLGSSTENVSSNVSQKKDPTQLLKISFLNEQMIEQNPVRKISFSKKISKLLGVLVSTEGSQAKRSTRLGAARARARQANPFSEGAPIGDVGLVQ